MPDMRRDFEMYSIKQFQNYSSGNSKAKLVSLPIYYSIAADSCIELCTFIGGLFLSC